MAILISNEKYQGSMGGLVFYQLNGKTVVRRKREKMTAREKKKVAGTRQGRAGKSNVMGSKFGRALRETKAYKFQADMYYHSAMTGHITNKVMVPTPEKGGIGTRSLLAEHVHRISSFTANSAISKKVLQALRKTRFIHVDDCIIAAIPEVPVEQLTGSKADHYRVWVNLKMINIKDMTCVWNNKIYSEAIKFGEKVSQTISFNPPKAKADEVLMAIVGVKSLVNGKMVENVKMNGFVYLGVEDSKSVNTQSANVNYFPSVGENAAGGSGQDKQTSLLNNLPSVDGPLMPGRQAEESSLTPLTMRNFDFQPLYKPKPGYLPQLSIFEGYRSHESQFPHFSPINSRTSDRAYESYVVFIG